jgi:phosphate transport system permease protein
MVWLAGGALAICLTMIVGMLGLILYQGAGSFWPRPLVRIETVQGRVLLGEPVGEERFRPSSEVVEGLPEPARSPARDALAAAGGEARRRELRTGNYELTGEHFTWVSDFEVADESRPPWALTIERTSWGRFYGTPVALLVDGAPVVRGAEAVCRSLPERIERADELRTERRELEREGIGALNTRQERARLRVREAELEHGEGSAAVAAARADLEREQPAIDAEYARIRAEIEALEAELRRVELAIEPAGGAETRLPLGSIVRAYPANELGFLDRVGLYVSRWVEFVLEDPRESKTEGGVWPAIFGTVLMTMIMSLAVVPFGVLAALYLREYAKPGPVVTVVRIAVNNLAGVPSIVFGVFGLGFFCYLAGAGIDRAFFAAQLPNPTFGKGGLAWASLTLALLTLPVVIVATEEALAAVPSSMREGSYGCGATKWQTIRYIVLPRAMPGIMTGMILAIARGAGEVAPLMLVGAANLAQELPLDGTFPYLHPQRSFMHLGLHIYDLGFQSQNSDAAKPMVFTTTLILIAIVVALNVTAILVRGRMRRRFAGGHL